MKNVAIILPNFRSGGSERFASRLSALLSENTKYISLSLKTRDRISNFPVSLSI